MTQGQEATMRRSCATRSIVPTLPTHLLAAAGLAATLLLASCGDRASDTKGDRDAAVKDSAPGEHRDGADNTDFSDAASDLKAAFARKTEPAPAASKRQGLIPGSREKLESPPKRPSDPAPKVYPE